MFHNASADQIAIAGRAPFQNSSVMTPEAADAMEQSSRLAISRQKAIDREDMRDNIDTIECDCFRRRMESW